MALQSLSVAAPARWLGTSLSKKSSCVQPALLCSPLSSSTADALFALPAGLCCSPEDGVLFIFSHNISHAGTEES